MEKQNTKKTRLSELTNAFMLVGTLCICFMLITLLPIGKDVLAATSTPWDTLSTTEKASLFDENLRPYYAKLNDNQKNVYKDIVEDLYQGNEWTYLYEGSIESQDAIPANKQVSHDEIKQVLIAISYDQPQIFWFGTKDINGQGYTYSAPYITKIHIYYNDYGTKNDEIDISTIAQNITKVETAANTILSKLTGTDAQNILTAHDTLCEYLTYDIDVYANHKYSTETGNTTNITESQVDSTIYNVFLNKKALCGGYARAFQYLMLKKGIYCEYVVGSVELKTDFYGASKTEDHAWNNVKINGKYYGVDVTWDDVWNEYFITASNTKKAYNVNRIDYADLLFNKTTFTNESRTYADISLQTVLDTADIFESTFGSPRYELYFDSVAKGLSTSKETVTFDEYNTITSLDGFNKLLKWNLANSGFEQFSFNIAILNSSVYDTLVEKNSSGKGVYMSGSTISSIATSFADLYRASGKIAYGGTISLQAVDNDWSYATVTYSVVPGSGFVYKTATASTAVMSYDGNYYYYKDSSSGTRYTVKRVKSIAIDSSTTKTYTKGQSLSGNLKLTYYDGSTATIDLLQAVIKGYNSSNVGTQNLTVIFNGMKTTLTVTVKDSSATKTITSISIGTYPTIKYTVGDSLNVSTGKLKVNYSDGTYTAVAMTASGVEVTGFDSTTAGSKTLTVTYGGKSVTYTITVAEAEDSGEETTDKDKTGVDLTTGLYWSNGLLDFSYTGYANPIGYVETDSRITKPYWYHVTRGVLDAGDGKNDWGYEGLYKDQNNVWRYYRYGKFQNTTTGFATDMTRYKSQKRVYRYRVEKGLINFHFTGMAESGNKCYYKEGRWMNTTTGFVTVGSVRYRIVSGKWATTYTAVVKDSGYYRYYKGGIWMSSYSGKVKIGKTTYTIVKGVKK